MQVFNINLKEEFPFLQTSAEPYMTCYIPDYMSEVNEVPSTRPCIFLLPGGGYCGTSTREAEPVASVFLHKRYNVFILRYSCAPNRYPEQLIECAAGMEIIYKNAEKWNCDLTKIAIMGFSAGGHLAAHYTNAFDCDDVRKVFPQSKGVNACILGYPVITAGEESHNASFENLLGRQPTDDDIKEFSCDKMVSDRTPPTFIFSTCVDTCVPVQSSYKYALALARNGVLCEMHVYPCCDHGASLANNAVYDDDGYNRFKGDFEYIENWADHLLNFCNPIFGR
ncbi:MAG: alpha/beta hydrolase [Oscillospiraceae bacterium]|nr:alpha/beta hydrolase [Candidatus Equicaccousia limihippi]